jgi:hypothetical protein
MDNDSNTSAVLTEDMITQYNWVVERRNTFRRNYKVDPIVKTVKG